MLATRHAQGPGYDPFSPEHWEDPYQVYRVLRRETPVYWARRSNVYCVARHDDSVFVLKHPELFSSRALATLARRHNARRFGLREIPPLLRFMLRARLNPLGMGREAGALSLLDPPHHRKLRRTVERAFAAGRIQALAPLMERVVDRCLANLRPGRVFDVIHELAIPLPLAVMGELLGIDPRRQDEFKRWTHAMLTLGTGGDLSDSRSVLEAAGDLHRFLRVLIRTRRNRPEDDLVSTIVDPRSNHPLAEGDALALLRLLLVAGSETTTHLIGNAVRALLDHPDQLALAQASPGRIPRVIEETLRWDPPAQLAFRTARQDTELAGTRIPKGAIVAVLLGSANRDERVFPNPERFDLTREPRGHLAFGIGIHHCLGASLSRLEARVALERLLPRLRGWRRRDPSLEFVGSLLVRGPKSLPLVSDRPDATNPTAARPDSWGEGTS